VSEGESPVPSVSGAAGSESLPPGNLTYNARLTKPELPAESIKPAVRPVPPSPALEEPPEAPPAAGGGERRPAAVAPVPDVFTVQIAAVLTRGEAQSIVNRLIKKGYPAYVFEPPGGDRTGGFRVRVGSFTSREEAEPTASRLQKEEQYKPWITR
jgi:DedD protein